MQTLSLIQNPRVGHFNPPPFYRWENWGKGSEATCPGSTVGGVAQDSFTGWLLSSIPKAPATLWGLAMGLEFRNCFLVLWNKNTFFSLRTCSPVVPDDPIEKRRMTFECGGQIRLNWGRVTLCTLVHRGSTGQLADMNRQVPESHWSASLAK